MINYPLKSKIINLGIHKEVNHAKGRLYNGFMSNTDDDYCTIYRDYYDFIDDFKQKYGYVCLDVWHECEKILNASFHRRSRLQKRIMAMMSLDGCKFITLTFTDDVLCNTTYDTRRKYVLRWCAKHSVYYIANIDFGAKNGREHYHAVIVSDSDINHTSWIHGAINFKRVVPSALGAVRLSKYVDKLVNHAIKDTARGYRVMYGRNSKELDAIYKILSNTNK